MESVRNLTNVLGNFRPWVNIGSDYLWLGMFRMVGGVSKRGRMGVKAEDCKIMHTKSDILLSLLSGEESIKLNDAVMTALEAELL